MLPEHKIHGFLFLMKHFSFENNEIIFYWHMITEERLQQLENYVQSELTYVEQKTMSIIPICLDILQNAARRCITISPDVCNSREV